MLTNLLAEAKNMTIAQNTALTRIGQIAINAHDVDRATAFYRDVLGLPHLFRAGQLSFFDCGGVRLMLDKAEKPEFDHPSSILYFQVTDIQAAYQRLKTAGAKFEDTPHLLVRMPKHDLWMTFFRDSEGNLLALMSEVAHEA
jgi:predicted enzyme related to lactoylglutathione lyase